MAAMESMLSKRYYSNGCPNGNYNGYDGCYSSWEVWARWVVLGIIILIAILLFFCCSCVTARRRRRMGQQPYWGTGWAGGNAPVGNQYHRPQQENNYQPYYASNSQAPPAYGASQGYYGGRNDVELQSPPNAYTHDPVYSAPSGPPPAKDGIIR